MSTDPELMRAIGRLEGKLDATHESVNELRDALFDGPDSVEGRVSSLERKQAWLWGAGSIVVAFFTTVAGYFGLGDRG